MAGRPHARAHAQIAEVLKVSITPPTERRCAPVEYEPSLLDEMIALARLGYAAAEIADHWSVSGEQLALWVAENPEFAGAYKRAATSAQAWWEAAARRALALDNNKFPAGAWAQVVRARFPDYREKLEVNHHIDISQLVIVTRPELTLIEGEAREVRAARGLRGPDDGSDLPPMAA